MLSGSAAAERRFRTILLILGLATLEAAGCRRPEPEIDRPSVERIISALSADDMQGRRALTPAAERAARFIRGEFESIGLEPLTGAQGYLQRFPVYALSVASSRVLLNGRQLPAERTAFSLSTSSVHWATDDAVDVVVIAAGDSPRQIFSAVFTRRGSNRLVLISPEHESVFERAKGFLAGPSRTLDLEGGASVALVLTGDTILTSYEVEATASVEEQELINVVGAIPGKRRDEAVLFSAHYDHIGIRDPVDGDSIANGANDNASGTTAVIELARYFKAKGKPTRTLVFVAFAAEEMGGYGSQYFSKQVDADEIVAMFNIEMIGKAAAQGPNTVWITGFDLTDVGAILQQPVEGTEYRFVADPYPEQNLFFRSDNAVFARLGVPAHSLSTTSLDLDPDYHQVSDEVETLDLDHLTKVIRAIAKAASAIVSGAATPARIDPAGLE
ncbi:MAG: M20/M25/M40 family metallo-hydrolase [Gemmatimonadota bacterium]|nr:MAG: M20/M25/M40 family metallo-hydrolase [Gemmatimonadota bacterium]